ncbi:hypothetical protein GCM10028864_26190 [Microlunatus parietis]
MEAALESLIERGIEATTIDQVARDAGVARTTVYRRYPDKNQLLIAAIKHGHDQLPLPPAPAEPTIEDVINALAIALADPRGRRLIRRNAYSLRDHPDLERSYRAASIQAREDAILDALTRAHRAGRFPPDSDPVMIQTLLLASITFHLFNYDDQRTESEIRDYFTAVLKHLGYRNKASKGSRR